MTLDDPKPPPPERERDDPRSEVGSFDPPAGGRRRRRGPVDEYRPNRADFERGEYWAERAAIREYLDGMDRFFAERLALEDTYAAHRRGEIP